MLYRGRFALLLLGGSFVEVIWVQAIMGWIPFMVALGLFEAPRQSLDREAGHGREMKRIFALSVESLAVA